MAWIKSHQALRNHRKLLQLARRLRADKVTLIGNLHLLWWWVIDNLPGGDTSKLDPEILAEVSEFKGDAMEYYSALKECGWIDENGMIHNYDDHFERLLIQRHESRERAKASSAARRLREGCAKVTLLDKSRVEKSREEEQQCSGEAPERVAEASQKPETQQQVPKFITEARVVIHFLNETASRSFHETDAHLKPIMARLREVKGDVEGVKAMIKRQVKLWGTNPKMVEYLRPATLFAATNFHNYYDSRNDPVQPVVGQHRVIAAL